MFLFRILLFPLAVLYDLITRIRNYLYDNGLKPSARFDVPVICVGNLVAGGTGKTPMIEYLARLLSSNGQVATLSRGYGRKTRGTRVAGNSDTAETLGDEPFQFHKKFSGKVIVTVGEERALAIPVIVDRFPDVNVILMDDAYQHRQVVPAMSILLTDFSRPFYTDYLLPTGYLREARKGASRADMVVVTKCPESISEETLMEMERHIRKYVEKPVFFSYIRYEHPVSFGRHKKVLTEKIILVTGIANAGHLRNYVTSNFILVKHLAFGDHHAYDVSDIEKIRELVAGTSDISILTTEKDMVKIAGENLKVVVEGLPFFYLPIEVSFIKGKSDFDEMVKNTLTREV
jgi:tetraacyldisaccharide 4'-kinase